MLFVLYCHLHYYYYYNYTLPIMVYYSCFLRRPIETANCAEQVMGWSKLKYITSVYSQSAFVYPCISFLIRIQALGWPCARFDLQNDAIITFMLRYILEEEGLEEQEEWDLGNLNHHFYAKLTSQWMIKKTLPEVIFILGKSRWHLHLRLSVARRPGCRPSGRAGAHKKPKVQKKTALI